MNGHRIAAACVIGLSCGVGACGVGNGTGANDNKTDGAPSAASQGVSGAIFTTNVNGTVVNGNIYASKDAVYLDGGPGPNAPPTAAGLPEGDYYFQVTDPSGHTLLSTDAIGCREFHVSSDGVITAVVVSGCEHATGIDQDHSELGAITVQLMPYDDTPNPGGEYKVWATPVASYGVSKENRFGFVPRFSKTDNFKVRVATPICDGRLVNGDCETKHVCGDGVVDTNEQCDDGNTTNGDGCSADCMIEHQSMCGDGVLDEGEACDDGNTTDGDGCSSDCMIEHQPACGDGVLDAGEECDDGNMVDGDGCSANCTVECMPTCGDGVLDAGEECDDGNTIGGDGCSATCMIEPCLNTPS